MSSSFYLLKDQRIFIDGAEYTVVRADHAGETLLESPATGLRQGYSAYQLVQMYTDGRLTTACWRRSKFDPPCRLNFDPGLGASIG